MGEEVWFGEEFVRVEEWGVAFGLIMKTMMMMNELNELQSSIDLIFDFRFSNV